MSLTFFPEPFYSLADFDRLFDEAFNARTGSQGQGSSALTQREGANAGARPMRPRYVTSVGPFAYEKRCSQGLDRMDLHEDQDKNLVTATFELPGLTKENVQIDVRDNVLTVSGESTISRRATLSASAASASSRGHSRSRRASRYAPSLSLIARE